MRVIASLLLTCAIASASTLTNPTFGASDPDVVGNPLLYDVQSISVSISGDQVMVVIDLNYGAQYSVIVDNGDEQYLYGLVFGVGDLFFYDPSAPTTQSCDVSTPPVKCVTVPTPSSLAYAVVLNGVDRNLDTGGLYAIGGDVTTVTASQAATVTPPDDRPNQVVEIGSTGDPSDTPGIETVTALCTIGSPGCGDTTAEYQVALSFTAPPGFLSLVSSGELGVEFSAADCGNAVISGVISTTPEPGTLAMVAVGIGMLGFGLARRRRKN